ncbi:MAG TPA: phosphatase PAP2 family protein [Rhizomicrobium sp.]|nr:phosphatase PAP2 family protein [Rhizomicrobium sp.]
MRAFFDVFGASIRRTFPAHAPLYVCAVAFCGLSLAITTYFRVSTSLGPSVLFLEVSAGLAFAAVMAGAVRQLCRLAWAKADRPIHAMGRWLRDGLLEGERPGHIFHGLLLLTPLMVSFSAIKDDIPLIAPFSWDQTFAHWDMMLGLGRAPWTYLQPWLGYPPITAAINFCYDAWFFVMFGALTAQAFSARPGELRMQFLLAFTLSWFIAGNMLALAFSSAGPCYFGLLHLPHDPYAAQMAYLRATAAHWPVWSVNVQDALWRYYIGQQTSVGGISAMPSMHVAVATIIAMLGWRLNRAAGWALSLFALVIVVGAIHLAWHYFVDTIAGASLGFVFWAVAGRIARRHGAWLASRNAPSLEELAPALSRS